MSITSRRQGRPNLGTRPHPRSQENLGRLLHGAGGYRVGRYPLRHGRGKVLAAVGHLGQTSRHRNSRALKLAPKTPVLVPRRRPKPMHKYKLLELRTRKCGVLNGSKKKKFHLGVFPA
ncbi:hypothetical protein TWF128_010883 [Orbilia oligospora]|nr:hypothetical protein TWF128_010883 [Orbilia oligospora]